MNEQLKTRISELRDLLGLINLATWDQETYMPSGAELARASQLSTIQALYHERLTDPRVADWLEKAHATSPDDREMVRTFARERDRATKVPSALVKALAEAQSMGVGAWKEAKSKRDFSLFRPHLEKLVTLRREQADAYGHSGERYDALLEGYEPGMRVSRLTPVLTSLREKLQPILNAIEAKPKPRNAFAGKKFEADAQWAFTLQLLHSMGFDMTRGRQDRSHHPFTNGFDLLDVRVTTRIFEDLPMSSVFSTIHEAGHGLYEQGFLESDRRTTLAQAPSMGIHESQSRLWENNVGRSRAFWQHFFPLYVAKFPAQMQGVSLDEFLGTVNTVERSFIRVEADEVTYNLHIVLRYELELAMLRGDLKVADLEGAWNEKALKLLGLTVRHPAEGVLQDIHWAWGEMGYFPTYSLGNLYAASLFAAAKRAMPVDEQLARGALQPLLTWLRTNVHQAGARLDTEPLITKVTGRGLTDVDFIEYLTQKYVRERA